MSGLNSFASNNDEKNSFNKLAIKVFKEYNFEYYKNINSFSRNSLNSIASLLNFSTEYSLLLICSAILAASCFFSLSFF
jgi:hypothetical protein